MTYAEREYHALADEQELAWPAEGERAARPTRYEHVASTGQQRRPTS